MNLRKIGSEIILTAILIPILAWILTSVIALQSSYATLKERSDLREETLKEIKDDVKFIRQQLEK
jgi:sensor domain CHASE-containing protein